MLDDPAQSSLGEVAAQAAQRETTAQVGVDACNGRAWYHEGVKSALSVVAVLLVACAGPQSQRIAAPDPAPEPTVVPEPQPEHAPQIRGNAARGWLGVELVSAPPEQAGALVRDVLRGSPAARAGIASGDRIIRVDGARITAPGDVVRAVSRRPAGARVSVALERSSGVRMLAVELGPAPADDSDVMRVRFVGQPAPRLTDLKTVQGVSVSSLRDLRGKVVVLEFWASWCAVCRFLVPKLNLWRDQYQAQGLELLAVTTDPMSIASATTSQLSMAYTVLSDPSGKTTEAYRALALPTLFVIDKKGIVRETVVGYDEESFAATELLIQRLIAED